METNTINVIKNRDSYIKKIKEELLGVAIKTKPSLKSDFKKYSLFLCQISEGEGVGNLDKLEADIAVDYLKTLRDDDAIKHFEIKVEKIKKRPIKNVEFLFPYEENVVAEIEFQPSTLIQYFKEEKFTKIPKFFCKKGYCFIKFGRKPEIKIAKISTRQCKLLNIIYDTPGIKRTIDGVFEDIKLKKDNNNSKLKDSYLVENAKIEIISNTVREIRRKFSNRSFIRRIKFNIDGKTILLDFN